MAATSGASYCASCGSALPAGAQFCQSCGAQVGRAVLVANYNVTGQRLIAGLIDIIILVVLFVLMAAAIGTFGETGDQRFDVRLNNEEFLLYIMACYFYFILFEGLAGVTLGKMVVGLQVVKLNGQPYDVGAVLIRNVLRIFDGLIYPFYIVGIISIAVTGKNQRLGDLAAGTTVVRAGL